jgi:PPOX class probable F420-dependent enzyme
MSPENITPEIITFLTERHLASLTTLRKDGSPHVVPVGFSFDESCNEVLVITFAGSQKVKNAERGGRAVVSQVDKGRWLSLEGTVRVATDEVAVARGVAGYAARYQAPKERVDRVVIIITVDKILGRA